MDSPSELYLVTERKCMCRFQQNGATSCIFFRNTVLTGAFLEAGRRVTLSFILSNSSLHEMPRERENSSHNNYSATATPVACNFSVGMHGATRVLVNPASSSPAERRHGTAKSWGRDDVTGRVVVDDAGEVRELALAAHEDALLPDARRRLAVAGLHLVHGRDDWIRAPPTHAGQRAPEPPGPRRRARPRVRRAQRQRQRAHGHECHYACHRCAEVARRCRRQSGGDRVQGEVARHAYFLECVHCSLTG
jgi:hypothetical protein